MRRNTEDVRFADFGVSKKVMGIGGAFNLLPSTILTHSYILVVPVGDVSRSQRVTFMQ